MMRSHLEATDRSIAIGTRGLSLEMGASKRAAKRVVVISISRKRRKGGRKFREERQGVARCFG